MWKETGNIWKKMRYHKGSRGTVFESYDSKWVWKGVRLPIQRSLLSERMLLSAGCYSPSGFQHNPGETWEPPTSPLAIIAAAHSVAGWLLLWCFPFVLKMLKLRVGSKECLSSAVACRVELIAQLSGRSQFIPWKRYSGWFDPAFTFTVAVTSLVSSNNWDLRGCQP